MDTPSPNGTTPHVASQIAIRLNAAERAAVASVLNTLRQPHRRDPSVSEAVRHALLTVAAIVSPAGARAA